MQRGDRDKAQQMFRQTEAVLPRLPEEYALFERARARAAIGDCCRRVDCI
jgi:hypothetical protein